jgi:uncharacterized spore protein YtfJ
MPSHDPRSIAVATETDTPTARIPQRRTDELLSLLAERVGARLGAANVFGTAVERDGVTVIPVAAARFGLGAGGGADPGKQQEGEGGGAGGSVTAIGYIELKDGRTRFVPVVHPARMLALVCAAALAGIAIVRPRSALVDPRRFVARMRRRVRP